MKKTICILLALVMCMTIGVCAAADNGIALSLDKTEVTAGETVTMRVATKNPLVPVSIAGEAYASDERITINAINDGDKELLASNTRTGRFAWMGGRNEDEVTTFAFVEFCIPKNTPPGEYRLGVTQMCAFDANCHDILGEDVAEITLIVKEAPESPSFSPWFGWFRTPTFFSWRWW